MFRTPKSLRSTAPKGVRLFNYDSDDEGDANDDVKEKRRNAKREHEELTQDGEAPDSPHTTVKAQRMLSYEDGVDVLGTIAALKDDDQEEVAPAPSAEDAGSPKPLSQPSVIVMEEDIEDGEGERQYYLHIRITPH
jgi:hypothetical protein